MQLSRSETALAPLSRSPVHRGCKTTFSGAQLQMTAPRQQRCRKTLSQMTSRVQCLLDITQSNFKEEVLQSDLPVLIDFWATWCGPCKLMDSTMEWLDKEYEGQLRVVKLETDKSKDLVEAYKVYGLPTLMIFRGGDIVQGSQREGVMTREEIVKYLDTFGIVSSSAAST